MHWIVALALVLLVTPGPLAAQELKTDDDRALYAIGLFLSDRLAPFALTAAELELVKAGLTDGALGRERKLDPRAQAARIQQLQQARAIVVAAVEKKAGQAVLARAAAEPNARTTDSGLVIVTLAAGSGPSPRATDRVRVHYHGTLADGSVFDSSVQRGQPATFPLSGVIKCWTEGLQQMKVGGKSRLACPAELAYGDRGAPPRIKPGATLLFEVELLEIVAE